MGGGRRGDNEADKRSGWIYGRKCSFKARNTQSQNAAKSCKSMTINPFNFPNPKRRKHTKKSTIFIFLPFASCFLFLS
jgi:hypothetical protein